MKNLKTLLALGLFTFGAVNAAPVLTDSGSLTIEGTIDTVVAITVTPTDATPLDGTYSGLDLNTAATNLTVANVQEESNSESGYTVTVEYDGLMLHTDGVTTFPYSLSYDGSAITTGSDIVTNDASGSVIDTTKTLGVTYTAADATNLSGTYTGTVDVTIDAI
ncbi:hypothetical protein OAT67_09315 [Bacteriovoracaceae bacterium]|nr:hypothetical protein [Bacteriovoracaceae bacterium]